MVESVDIRSIDIQSILYLGNVKILLIMLFIQSVYDFVRKMFYNCCSSLLEFKNFQFLITR